MDDEDILTLNDIVDQKPNLYLDKLAFLFSIKTDESVHYSTIWRCIVEKLGYNMKVLTMVTKQQCEANEIRFLQALEIILQSCLDRLVTIDETHKDWNAAIRRCG